MDAEKLLEMARNLDKFGETKRALTAYTLALQAGIEDDPASELEAAIYILQNNGNYKISYTCFVNIFNRGFFHGAVLPIMTEAFYLPNVREIKTRYESNCKRLEKYPYIFRKNFPDFDELPIQFFPYEGNAYVPYYPQKESFGQYVNFSEPVVTRNYFKDLEKPILAENVYSQYELEYLCDNLRKSEYIGRENHLYLHYTSWEEFCSYLQCINLSNILIEKKPVFLFENEINRYPLDFEKEFGIDYSQYKVRPVSIREVNKLIWHTQLSSHNGGDFFNEIFDGHPNLITLPSIMFDNTQENVANMKKMIKAGSVPSEFGARDGDKEKEKRLVRELLRLKNPTDKDYFVTLFMCTGDMRSLDPVSRICPAIFFQPHFPNIVYEISKDRDSDRARLYSEEYEKVRRSRLFSSFKYIKTFTPMRRITVSYGGTVKFVSKDREKRLKRNLDSNETPVVVDDVIIQRVLNRSYMIDSQDRLFKDSVLVRFEDGKLNPKATFTALAAFLDIPYDKSLTYCSEFGVRDPITDGNVIGMDPATVFRTYDEYTNDAERCFLEFLSRDAYEFYGYDFQYYNGEEMDPTNIKELISNFGYINELIEESHASALRSSDIETSSGKEINKEGLASLQKSYGKERRRIYDDNRFIVAMALMGSLKFENRSGQPLHMMPKLELDPALLEQPLYH